MADGMTSIELTDEVASRLPKHPVGWDGTQAVAVESLHQVVKVTVEVLSELGFLMLVPTPEEAEQNGAS